MLVERLSGSIAAANRHADARGGRRGGFVLPDPARSGRPGAASTEVLARGRAEELAVHAEELRVAAEAGLERSAQQALVPALHRAQEAFDAQPVSVLDQGEPHF